MSEVLILTDPNCAYPHGHVYFVQVGNEGPVKIGFTAAMWSGRISEIRTSRGKPSPLLLVRSNSGLELKLHAMLEPYHLGGEWFTPEPVLEIIDALKVGAFDWSALPDGWCVTKRYQTKASLRHWGELPQYGRIAA